MTTFYASQEGRGGFSLYKTGGQTANIALNTQTNIAVIDAPTDNPLNNSYPGLANGGAAGAMNVIKGGKTPILMATTAAHPTWFTYLNCADWIGSSDAYLDGGFNTSEYSGYLGEPVAGYDNYDQGHCQSIVISYNAQGGAIMVQMMWPFIWGPGEYAAAGNTSPTFAGFTKQYGQCYTRADCKITGFDQDKSWVLALVHAQARQFQAPTVSLNTGLNAVAMTSHSVGGSLAIERSKTGTTVPSSTCSIQIGPATTGVKFTLYVNVDRVRKSFPGNAPGSVFNEYSLADITNANSTTPGYPFIITAGV